MVHVVSQMKYEPREEGTTTSSLNGPGGRQADSLSSKAASWCLGKRPLHPPGGISILVFHGSGAGLHCSMDKILVNSKALRDGGKFRELLETPINPDIVYSFCKHLLSY